MDILHKEFHRVARLWNLHRIRPSSNMASSAGRLDFLFFLPEANDARNYLKLVDIEDIEKKDVVRGFHPMAVMKMLQS